MTWYFWWQHMACGILGPRSGTEPMSPALETQSLNHCTAREIPLALTFTFLTASAQPPSPGSRGTSWKQWQILGAPGKGQWRDCLSNVGRVQRLTWGGDSLRHQELWGADILTAPKGQRRLKLLEMRRHPWLEGAPKLQGDISVQWR